MTGPKVIEGNPNAVPAGSYVWATQGNLTRIVYVRTYEEYQQATHALVECVGVENVHAKIGG